MNNYQMNDNNIIKLILLILLIIILFFFKNTSKFTKFTTNFTSFYSEGPPNDEALDLSDCVPEILNGATGRFNKITFYTPKKMRDLGYGRYVKKHKLYPLTNRWTPIEKIGLSAFNPVMLLHELSQMNDGDILVSRNINWKKYPNYKNFDEYPELAEKILKECQFDFFINISTIPTKNTYHLLKNHVKAKVIRELGGDSEYIKNFHSFHAYMFIMRKSKITIELLNEWKSAVEKDEWLNGDISDEPYQPELIDHGLDQGILSIIIANWIRKGKNNIPKKYPIIKLLQEKNEIVKIEDSYFDYLHYF